jgi:hypothetical protein
MTTTDQIQLGYALISFGLVSFVFAIYLSAVNLFVELLRCRLRVRAGAKRPAAPEPAQEQADK